MFGNQPCFFNGTVSVFIILSDIYVYVYIRIYQSLIKDKLIILLKR